VATVVPVDGADSAALRNALERELQAAGEEYRPAEPNLEFAIEETEAPKAVLNDDSTGRVIALIVSLPHGVVSMSYDIKGLVETSTNLAAVAESDGRLSILLSSRSSVASALDALRQRIRAIVSLAGGEVEEDPGYPGWQPDVSSPLLQVVKQLHEEVIGETPEVGAVHAGLECGIIGEKYPGMDMISFGPQIEFPHSPDERIKVSTVKPFYELLAATLRKLA
jgi:dipeptidase D